MNRQHPVYTEKNNCQDCYKCLRQCPVKAIQVEAGSASILPDHCIYCGHCVLVCPADAKKVRNDMPRVLDLLDGPHKVILSLAPSYMSEFAETEIALLPSVLTRLGFAGVSETALGAELVARQTRDWLALQSDGVYISSCCPSTVDYICKYHPELKSSLVPLFSPMQAHALMLKSLYGENCRVVFAGPCVAKKAETDQQPNLTDAAITFRDLRDWLEEAYPNWQTREQKGAVSFIPHAAGKGNFFPVDGGMIANMKAEASVTDVFFMSFSGVNHVRSIVNDIPRWELKGKTFLELLICEGGCINGPGTIDQSSAALKRQRILKRTNPGAESENAELSAMPDISHRFDKVSAVVKKQFSEESIQGVLQSIGKFRPEDELNCSGCGYDNCRDFARALLEGKAERTMCVTYMRRVAQDKASVLLQKIPSAVVMVDEHLKVLDCNRKFIGLMSQETQEVFEINQSLAGADLRKLVSYHKLFAALLQSGEEMSEHDIREDDRYLKLSVVSIQPGKIVCGVVQDMHEPEVRRDIVLEHTQQVIKQNMEVVQKIAFLLGENASFTESMLKSILESHKDSKNKE
jgi:iron only hydrogenase large subunit-like protein